MKPGIIQIIKEWTEREWKNGRPPSFVNHYSFPSCTEFEKILKEDFRSKYPLQLKQIVYSYQCIFSSLKREAQRCSTRSSSPHPQYCPNYMNNIEEKKT